MQHISKILLVVWTAGLLTQFGCSASTNSSRYQNNSSKKKTNNENLRYQNEKEQKLNSSNTSLQDTSDYNDEEEFLENFLTY